MFLLYMLCLCFIKRMKYMNSWPPNPMFPDVICWIKAGLEFTPLETSNSMLWYLLPLTLTAVTSISMYCDIYFKIYISKPVLFFSSALWRRRGRRRRRRRGRRNVHVGIKNGITHTSNNGRHTTNVGYTGIKYGYRGNRWNTQAQHNFFNG